MAKKILIVEDEYIIADVLRGMLINGGYKVCGIADTVAEALDLIASHRPEFVLVDIHLKGKLTGIDLAHRLNESNIPFIYISANASQKILEAAKVTNPYGFVIKPFREKDVIIALEIAIYRHENNLESGLRQSALLQKKIAEIVSSETDWEQKMLVMGKTLQPWLPFEFLSIGLMLENGESYSSIGFLRIGFNEYQVIGDKELMMITHLTKNELPVLDAKDSREIMPTWYNEPEFNLLLKKSSVKKLLSDTFDLQSHLTLPFSLSGDKTGYFNFYSRRPDAYHENHLLLCNRFQHLLISFLENMPHPKDSQSPVVDYDYSTNQSGTMKQEPDLFEGIVGSSHLLLNVFDQVMQVAKFDSSVLILGESGTGKEKIAERIHRLSLRKDAPFVRVNCAALPVTLIDSELFGHEKGSFTGALERKAGRFERAHTGTIFLDEIGELPLESQSKLLRVLQEKEIERIGGKEPVKTDVRIIAATNRNLEKEVAEGRFRLDLFYRINVFPVTMPPLRERKEDIPALANHFLKIYAGKTGKTIHGISASVLDNMKNHSWPGNIRELENLIERNVLITKGDTINSMMLPVITTQSVPAESAETIIKTMTENEKAHILNALKKSKGKIWGEGGAASLLNLPPTTLNSKMRKLGIRKRFDDHS